MINKSELSLQVFLYGKESGRIFTGFDTGHMGNTSPISPKVHELLKQKLEQKMKPFCCNIRTYFNGSAPCGHFAFYQRNLNIGIDNLIDFFKERKHKLWAPGAFRVDVYDKNNFYKGLL